MIRRLFLKLGLTLSISITMLATGCASLGPSAKINVVKGEVKQTKKVKNILIANPVGMPDAKAYFIGAALTHTPPKGQPMAVIEKTLGALGLPSDVQPIILAAYQVEFAKLAKPFIEKGKGKKGPRRMKLPKTTAKVPQKPNDAKALVDKVKSQLDKAGSIKEAIEKGDVKAAVSAVAANKDLMDTVNAIAAYIIDKNDITYLALSYYSGSEEDYKSKKELKLTAALVNAKTGKFRFFGSVKAKKDMVPVPYDAQITQMTNAIYSGGDEKAPW